MRRRVAGPTPQRTLILRGVVFSVVAVVAGVLLVGRGAGLFDTGTTVWSVLPAQAGRVPVNAPVYHLGVKVGDVRASEGARVPAAAGAGAGAGVGGGAGGGAGGGTGAVAGARGNDRDDDNNTAEPGTRIEMLIGKDFAERIPAGVLVRAVPRTLFGDIRLDLVPPGGASDASGPPEPGAVARPRAGAFAGATLAGGEELRADTSDEAVLLYDVFTRASDLLVATNPQDLQITLTALARALDGRGELLGRTISDADRAGAELSPALENSAAATPALAILAEDLAGATPEILETVREATRLSQIVLDRPGSLGRLLDAGLATTGSGVVMADRTIPGAIRLVDDTGVVFDRTARNPHGVVRTLYAMRPMGEAGAAAFATGRFTITAVPSFADPMPYGPQECPRHPDLAGSTCSGAPAPEHDPGLTINAAGEREYLRELQAAAASAPGSPVPPPADTDPAAAAWTMLGPLVRGTEVTVR